MEESIFFIPMLQQQENLSKMGAYIQNLQGVFKVEICTESSSVIVKHLKWVKRRDICKALNKLGFSERLE
jgi:hypothetical protein